MPRVIGVGGRKGGALISGSGVGAVIPSRAVGRISHLGQWVTWLTTTIWLTMMTARLCGDALMVFHGIPYRYYDCNNSWARPGFPSPDKAVRCA